MKLHVYPVVNLPDFLSRFYEQLEEKPKRRSFPSLFRRREYVPKMPKSIEEVQLEYSDPNAHLPPEELEDFLDHTIRKFLYGGFSKLYMLHLGRKLPRSSKVFDADRKVCDDLAVNFMQHEYTGVFEGYVVEGLFVPECTKEYVWAFYDDLPASIMESNIVVDDGTVLSSVINDLIEGESRLESGGITLGVSPRPLKTFLTCVRNEDGSLSPLAHSGVRSGDNTLISYGFVYNKSILRHTSLLDVPYLGGSLGYAVSLNYNIMIGMLTEFGLHEWYHALGLDHDMKNICNMNPSHMGPFDKPVLELCDACKVKALAKAEARKEKIGSGSNHQP